jgi:hypothetical protein
MSAGVGARLVLAVVMVAVLASPLPQQAVAADPVAPHAPQVPVVEDPLAPYRGLGTWVDIYDAHTWDRPLASVRRMHRKGVRTLYVETANYRIDRPVFRPRALGALLDAAKARGLRVIAWYLPSYDNLRRDYRRSMAAISFTSSQGNTFDGFAMDIESDVVRDIQTRNQRLRELTRRVREQVGADYTMAAIVPEAGALYWLGFPYRLVARQYDIFLPMAYYTFRTSGAAGVRTWMARNIRAIRRETGNPEIPIHVIGGLSRDTTLTELRAFADTVESAGVTGASVYKFEATTDRHWDVLARFAGPEPLQ